MTRLARRLIEAGRAADARVVTMRVAQLLRARADAPEAVASRSTEYAWLLHVGQPIDLRDPATELAHASRAAAATHRQNPDVLAVLAVAQHLTGDTDGAVATALEAYALLPEMRSGRDEATLRRDIRRHLHRHPLVPLPRPLVLMAMPAAGETETANPVRIGPLPRVTRYAGRAFGPAASAPLPRRRP